MLKRWLDLPQLHAHQLSLIWHFSRQELIERYTGSIFGRLWALIQPLVNILIFIFVFAHIMGARLPLDAIPSQAGIAPTYAYSLYLTTGMLAWVAFSACLARVANVYQHKAHLLHKLPLSLLVLPLYIPLTESLIYGLSMALFALFLTTIGVSITLYWLWLPVLLGILLAWALGLGLIAAMLGVFLRDLRELVPVLLQLGFWMTPIVYVPDILPETWRWCLYLNPLYPLLEAFRDVVLYQQHPSLWVLGLLGGIGLALFVGARALKQRLQGALRDHI